jgi:formylmethanofuran dehydrogenase subunit E
MKSLEELLKKSAEAHGGHLCPGQVLGVRMAMKGCELIGIDDPEASSAHRKKIIVYVEIDRCATDAISVVTGCKLGKRTMKFKDYGIMAATFVNLETGRAFRISAREEAKTLAAQYAPEIEDRCKRELEAYRIMLDEELFEAEEVAVNIPIYDLPGRPRKKVQCHSCGEWVRDDRERKQNGTVLCQICADGAYFRRPQKGALLNAPAGNWHGLPPQTPLLNNPKTTRGKQSNTRMKVPKP